MKAHGGWPQATEGIEATHFLGSGATACKRSSE